jgi:NADP-dependent aldehyde dehydrogenase
VLLVPRDSAVVDRLAAAELPGPASLLYPRIQDGYVETLRGLADQPAVSVLRSGDPYADPPSPTLLTTTAADLLADLRQGRDEVFRECFGPTTLVAAYESEEELLAVAEAIDGQLTASIIGTDDDPVVAPLRDTLARKAGRVLWNGWPTGVSVTYAQQHGGPYPATTAPTTTSVGTGAIARFLRPVAYQGFPQQLLPAALRDDSDLPRLVDGRRQ